MVAVHFSPSDLKWKVSLKEVPCTCKRPFQSPSIVDWVLAEYGRMAIMISIAIKTLIFMDLDEYLRTPSKVKEGRNRGKHIGRNGHIKGGMADEIPQKKELMPSVMEVMTST